MIKDFKAQTAKTIMDFLRKKGRRPHIFSTCMDGVTPSLRHDKLFIYSTTRELVVVDWNHYTEADSEVADEEPFAANEAPLYFSEFHHRKSPVYALARTLESYAEAIEGAGFKAPRMWGVLLTNTTILNRQSMEDTWNEMNITVIDGMKQPQLLPLPLNEDPQLACYKWIKAIQEYGFEDMIDLYDDDDDNNDDVNDNDDVDDDDVELDDFPNIDDEDTAETSTTDGLSHLFLPDGELMLSPTNTIHVEILPPIDNPREELNRLVGCKDIKNRIDEMVELTRYNQLIQRLDPESKTHIVSLHGVFTGRPGTGKTTLCKIYGSLLHEAGVLSKGHVVVTSRNTFIGNNWGDEERVVREVVDMAQGGVLMIDEAYLLNSDNRNDPGKMVIPQLMNILADEKKRDIAIILCGYKKEMDRLIELNPGLQSRFPNRFDFPDFTIDELLEITRRRIQEFDYHFTRSAWTKYKSLLELAYTNRDPMTWGNARFVANQLERIYVNHARRCLRARKMDKKFIHTITTADIEIVNVPVAKPRIGF